MKDSFYSSPIKPHYYSQNNTINRRHITLRDVYTCTSTIKTQPTLSTPSRCRGNFHSSPHHQNNRRHTNTISSTVHQSQSHTSIALSPITINKDTDKNRQSNTNTRSHTSVSNSHSQPNFHVSEYNSISRSTFSTTYHPSRPRSRSQSPPRFPPLSPISYPPYLLPMEQSETKKKDLPHFSAKKKIIAKTLNKSLNYLSSTTTIKYMKDNNIAKQTDTKQLKKNLEIQKVDPTRTNNSAMSVRSSVNDFIPTYSQTPQKLCTTLSTVYTNHLVESTTNPRSKNVSKTLSGFYSWNLRPPA